MRVCIIYKLFSETMKKKLTYRQQQFLSQFLDVYREMKKPLPYAVVAERVGVNKVTAYEMLRLLEEAGLVGAEYEPTMEQHGPGRPAVLFLPTPEAARLMNSLSGKKEGVEDWEVEKNRILEQLKQGRVNGYEDLLSNLLDRIPDRRTPLIFLTELITSVILALLSLKESPEIKAIILRLEKIGLPQEVPLGVISGISVILSVMEKSNRNTATVLLSQMNRYEDTLAELSEEKRRQLSEFAREAVHIVLG